MSLYRSVRRLYKALSSHPMAEGRKGAIIVRFLRWQIATRLFPASYAVSFVGDTQLLVRRGMTGATGNVYFGLHEYADMGFAAHLLREGDLFCDIGANIGAYSILAAGAAGAQVIAVEPVPSTARALEDNIRLNRLEDKIRVEQVVIGAAEGAVPFTLGNDTRVRTH